jgi:hypothetical protein
MALQTTPKAGTMNVTVLAATAVVRRSTRKKIGQANAVEIVPTAISAMSPSTCGVPGIPVRSATGSTTSAPVVSIPVASSIGCTSDILART